MEEGADSLAGRVQTLDVGMLTLSEIAQIRSDSTLPTMLGDMSSLPELVDPAFWDDLVAQGRKHRSARDAALRFFSEFGGYPFAHGKSGAPWGSIAAQLLEMVVRRFVGHDLQAVLDEQQMDLSIEEVFRLCCRYAGQTPTLERLAAILRDNVGGDVSADDVRRALSVLERSLLVKAVPSLEVRLKKNRGAPKLCLIDHAVRAAWFGETISLDPDRLKADGAADLAGHIVESIVGTYLGGVRGLNLAHIPARKGELEVDFVLTVGAKRIPLEVNYRRKPRPQDFDGLQAFMKQQRNNAPFGILVTQHDMDGAPDGVIVVPLPTLLMLH